MAKNGNTCFPYKELEQVLKNPEDYSVKQLIDVLKMTFALTVEVDCPDEFDIDSTPPLIKGDLDVLFMQMGVIIGTVGCDIGVVGNADTIKERAEHRRLLEELGIARIFESYLLGVPMEDLMATSSGYRLLERS